MATAIPTCLGLHPITCATSTRRTGPRWATRRSVRYTSWHRLSQSTRRAIAALLVGGLRRTAGAEQDLDGIERSPGPRQLAGKEQHPRRQPQHGDPFEVDPRLETLQDGANRGRDAHQRLLQVADGPVPF